MMGSIGCMLGASSLDDFANSSSINQRGLFALPIFSFNSVSSLQMNQSTNIEFDFSLGMRGMIKLLLSAYLFYCYVIPSIYQSYSQFQKSSKFSYSFIGIVTSSLAVLRNPKQLVKDGFQITYAESEEILTNCIRSKKLNYNFFMSMIKTLNLEDSAQNSFIQALYWKWISEWLAMNDYKPLNSLFNKIIVEKAGEKHWLKSVEYLKSENLNELTMQKFKDITLYEKVIFHKSDNAELTDIFSKFLINKLYQLCVKKNIELEILRFEFLKLDDLSKLEQTNISNGCTELKSEIMKLLRRIELFDHSTDDEMKLKCKLLEFFTEPNSKLLSECIEFSKSRFDQDNNEINIGILSAALKYQLMFTNDYESSFKILIKFRFPDVKHNKLSCFQFLSLLNVYELLSIDLINSLNEYASNHKLSSRYDPNQCFKLNKLLVNILGHMRVYLGENTSDSTAELPNELKDYLVDGLVNSIQQLYDA